jgi:peptidoglycan/LPS O-acetylase OafA/YrhL
MKTIAFRYGLIFFGGLMAIFLVSYLLGQGTNYNLRFLNGILHLGILYVAINSLRAKQPETHQNYVSGVAQGMYTGGVGTIAFTIFMVLFLSLNPAFLAGIQETTGFGDRLTPIMAGALIFMEGVGVSLIAAYLLTRIIDNRIEKSQRESGMNYASRE